MRTKPPMLHCIAKFHPYMVPVAPINTTLALCKLERHIVHAYFVLLSTHKCLTRCPQDFFLVACVVDRFLVAVQFRECSTFIWIINMNNPHLLDSRDFLLTAIQYISIVHTQQHCIASQSHYSKLSSYLSS